MSGGAQDLEIRERLRVDKWLWHARFARSRTLAARLVSEGHVRIDGKRADDPAKAVRIGSVLTLALPQGVRVVEVLQLAEKRGGAPLASTFYRDLTQA